MLPKMLKNLNAFVDGRGYAGRIEEINLPTLTLKTEEYRGGGMDMPVDIALGMEKLEADLTFADYDAELFRRFGLMDNAITAITLRGGLQNGDKTEPVIINLRALIRSLECGSWKAGEKTTLKMSLSVNYYKLTLNHQELIEIDAENMVRKIDGTDQLSTMREALGI
nr:phage major tail tube protein [Coxiellaceae bacterium]